MRVTITEETLARFPENQQAFCLTMPSWVNIVYALEVFGGVLGCIGLLLRKKWALMMFVISIVGVLCQTAYVWFISDARTLMGSMAIMMPLAALCIGITLLLFSQVSMKRSWLQ